MGWSRWTEEPALSQMLGACTLSLPSDPNPCFPSGEGPFYMSLHCLISLCSKLTVGKSLRHPLPSVFVYKCCF